MKNIRQMTRVPNGCAACRVQVALPVDVMLALRREANSSYRTLSAMVACIVRQHYAGDSIPAEATASQP